MIFLIDYERKKGLLHKFKRFHDHQRAEAQRERLELELRLKREWEEREVVILEAKNEEIVRRTHQRYFMTIRDIVESMFAVESTKH